MNDKISITEDINKAIHDLKKTLEETSLSEIEVQFKNGIKIKVSKHAGIATSTLSNQQSAPIVREANLLEATKKSPLIKDHPGVVKSPMVGTAYVAPEPGSKPFVKVGDKVKKGQTVLIVEAMKTMNQIESPISGEIKSIFIGDAQVVEYGESLLEIV